MYSDMSRIRMTIPPVSPAALAPLYQQIVDGLKREISEGRLQPGSPLPSFRALAKELMVSIITVKRAYEELESQHIIYSKQGLGTYVAEQGAERSREVKRSRAEELLRESLREAREAGLGTQELLTLVRKLVRSEGDGR
jgi:GntR family transcriptional regulator